MLGGHTYILRIVTIEPAGKLCCEPFNQSSLATCADIVHVWPQIAFVRKSMVLYGPMYDLACIPDVYLLVLRTSTAVAPTYGHSQTPQDHAYDRTYVNMLVGWQVLCAAMWLKATL